MENLRHFEKILIAVDDSKYSYHAAAYGFDLADRLNATVALAHINELPIAVNITGDPILGDSGMIMPELLDIQKERAAALLKKIKTDFANGQDVKEFIVEGNITDQIVEIAKEFDASLIVMGTHGRTGFSHFISGSIAEQVTRHAKCPVLIVPNKD